MTAAIKIMKPRISACCSVSMMTHAVGEARFFGCRKCGLSYKEKVAVEMTPTREECSCCGKEVPVLEVRLDLHGNAVCFSCLLDVI